ncbi:MAG: Bax inhibitor-1/YccA family protein [Micrococcales bacterium]|nr:Bax inhibitor-1/YccA family protein [Micrococcales bacterium]
MANPVFTRSVYTERPGMREYGPPVGFHDAPAYSAPPDASTLEAAWEAGTATRYHTGRLSYEDVIIKTAGLLALVLVGGVAGWVYPVLALPGCLIGLVLGLVCAFRREPKPGLMSIYAVFEGMMLGGASRYFEESAGGIVLQAVVATLATFVVVLLLFSSGKVRTSPRGRRIVLAAMGGYVLFSLINLALVWTGVLPDFGLRSMEIGGMPAGLVISILAVLLGAYSLVMDFEMIKLGVEGGIDRRYAWTGAFALTVTLIWLYLEFLRILGHLRR